MQFAGNISEIRQEQIASKRHQRLWQLENKVERAQRYRPTIQYKTTRKVFKKSRFGKVIVEHDQSPYPHSSTRQQARYARQLAAGKLDLIPG